MTQVLVDRDALAQMLKECYDLMVAYAVEGGALRPSQGEQLTLESGSPLVVLAVQAGLPIPGPMEPGTVPPAPPVGPKAGVYYAFDDARPRCSEDGKVIYTTLRHAQHAARKISEARQPMRAYLSGCGHYHLSRVK
jgi:hypothetical protein